MGADELCCWVAESGKCTQDPASDLDLLQLPGPLLQTLPLRAPVGLYVPGDSDHVLLILKA